MIKLIQNIDIYAPEHLGKKDVLIIHDKIVKIADAGSLSIPSYFPESEQIDGTNLILTPGFIDCHVHVLGRGRRGRFCQSYTRGYHGRAHQIRRDNCCWLSWH